MIFTKNGTRYMLTDRWWLPRVSLYQWAECRWVMVVVDVETSGILPV